MWPNERLINLFGIELPIIQAPMAGSAFSDMVVAVSDSGGLGSLAWCVVECGTGAQRAGNHPPKDIAPNQCEFLLSSAASR